MSADTADMVSIPVKPASNACDVLQLMFPSFPIVRVLME
jgi:hypothetical protein